MNRTCRCSRSFVGQHQWLQANSIENHLPSKMCRNYWFLAISVDLLSSRRCVDASMRCDNVYCSAYEPKTLVWMAAKNSADKNKMQCVATMQSGDKITDRNKYGLPFAASRLARTWISKFTEIKRRLLQPLSSSSDSVLCLHAVVVVGWVLFCLDFPCARHAVRHTWQTEVGWCSFVSLFRCILLSSLNII